MPAHPGSNCTAGSLFFNVSLPTLPFYCKSCRNLSANEVEACNLQVTCIHRAQGGSLLLIAVNGKERKRYAHAPPGIALPRGRGWSGRLQRARRKKQGRARGHQPAKGAETEVHNTGGQRQYKKWRCRALAALPAPAEAGPSRNAPPYLLLYTSAEMAGPTPSGRVRQPLAPRRAAPSTPAAQPRPPKKYIHASEWWYRKRRG